MALATTCPQCKTSFKVVPDQLKLRRGLVRCGVCQHVFSGIDFLRYVDDAGQATTPPGATPAGRRSDARPTDDGAPARSAAEDAGGRDPSPAGRGAASAAGNPTTGAGTASSAPRRPRSDVDDDGLSPDRADEGPGRSAAHPRPGAAGSGHPGASRPGSGHAGSGHGGSGHTDSRDAGSDHRDSHHRASGHPGFDPDHPASPGPSDGASASARYADGGSAYAGFAAGGPDPAADLDRGFAGRGADASRQPPDPSTDDDFDNGPPARFVDFDPLDPPTRFDASSSFATDDATGAEGQAREGARARADDDFDADTDPAPGRPPSSDGTFPGTDIDPPSGPEADDEAGDTDDSLATRFYLADSDDGPFGQRPANEVRPPASIINPEAGGAILPMAIGSAVFRETTETAETAGTTGTADPALAPLPEAAGEHVESLADWIDGRSEAAEASRARRRARRRQIGIRDSARADGRDGPGHPVDRDAGGRPFEDELDPARSGDGTTARRRAGPAQPARSLSSRFPALASAGEAEPGPRRFSDAAVDPDLPVGPRVWRRRRIVAALLILAVWQLMLAFRNDIASAVPLTRPLLTALGSPLGLTVEPLRRIDDLSIEAFEIQDLGRNGEYALSAVIRNRAGVALRWPAMELTLLDASRNVVVRKVIEPDAYLGARDPASGIAPRSEQPIRLTLETRNIRMAGYSVALFYP